ncbi:MAG: hypothetical protein VX374_00715, partial [Pseudomonadota bacterium]|nr:hypothetical protein [Pseudomonadota bacterium]
RSQRRRRQKIRITEKYQPAVFRLAGPILAPVARLPDERALVRGAFAVIGAGICQAASGATTRPEDLDVET